eukprot:488696-Pleurochrysis_carterae.AAC.1
MTVCDRLQAKDVVGGDADSYENGADCAGVTDEGRGFAEQKSCGGEGGGVEGGGVESGVEGVGVQDGLESVGEGGVEGSEENCAEGGVKGNAEIRLVEGGAEGGVEGGVKNRWRAG